MKTVMALGTLVLIVGYSVAWLRGAWLGAFRRRYREGAFWIVWAIYLSLVVDRALR